ncbi:Fungal specific transcription factor domain [Geosmithia morbida]|uniref:Fungal specific transcription factor domain n=1 Tax=Geosmithia morbida TaxID=1094350 RepID=A0A9P4YRU7_9HYPO|nr:Fungal specific transcription factor domain [Geosmithia morbida]KAF4120682.1 Fungal specific transcription factor domain [Geosmithia morbida]
MATLNRLSVRCSRTSPRCDWCTTHGVDPESSTPSSPPSVAAPPLITSLSLPPVGPSPSASTGSYAASIDAARATSGAFTPSWVRTAAAAAAGSTSALASGGRQTADTSGDPSARAMDVLREAMDCVHRLRLQSYCSSIVTDEIKVPPSLAKSWVRNYFAQKPTDMFLKLIDRKFFEMMPDMMTSPHVHFDSCVLVIYYCILWSGSSLPDDTQDPQDAGRWTKLTYLGCLRALPAWQREATGCMMDLIAAISLTRVAGTSFDYEMSWKSFKLACEYAQGLGIHNLDGGDGDLMSGIHNPDISDDDRKGFWDLIQVDAFFRLMFDKPASISGNSWKVNLPWLNPGSSPAVGTGTAMMLFLVSSRVTLILLQFFAMLEEYPAEEPVRLFRRTEDMCGQIRALYDEWQPLQLITNSDITTMDRWMVVDVTLRGYTCIIFMLRKMAIPDSSPSTATPLALDVARQVLGIVSRLVGQYPFPATLGATFGPFRAYVPFAYVIGHLLSCPDIGAYRADVEALAKATWGIRRVASRDGGFLPLAKAMEGLNADVQRRFKSRDG